MTTLYLDRQVASIEREGDSLLIRDRQGRRGNLPLRQLDRIVVRGTVALDTGVLGHLGDRGVLLTLLSGRHHRLLGNFTGPLHNDARRRLGQARAYDDPAWVQGWGKRLILLKLRSQIHFLEQLAVVRGDARLPLRKAVISLREARKELLKATVPGRQTLLGIEGGSAQVYFSGLAAALPPSFHFSGRNRRPPRDPFNAMLSLGYTLLHGDAVKAIWMAGLDPFLGFYHQPAHGRESLASDMIEPLRVQVDRLCWDLCREQRITVRHFGCDGEACLMSKGGRRHFYQAYERRMPVARSALRRVALTLAKRFSTYPSVQESQG